MTQASPRSRAAVDRDREESSREPRALSLVQLLALLVAGATLTEPLVAQSDYFPLDVGIRSRFESDGFGEPIELEVLEQVGETFELQWGHERVLVRSEGNRLDIELEGEFRLAYDFDADRFEHADLFECDSGRVASIVDRRAILETPLGLFEDVLVVSYGPGRCADAGVEIEYFAPGIGLIGWSETSFTGPREYLIVEHGDAGPPPPPIFIRGDVNGDLERNISDPVFTLNWLFLGGPEPGCLDAADFDDSGEILISDAVSLLTCLFVSCEIGDVFCDFDRTDDDPLDCRAGSDAC